MFPHRVTIGSDTALQESIEPHSISYNNRKTAKMSGFGILNQATVATEQRFCYSTCDVCYSGHP